jgi:N-acetylated-alpha-linked acidic dipeptidase
LKQKAVAYLNVDEATSGNNFQGDAVGSLAPMLVEVSHTLPAPTGKSLYEEWKVSRKAEMNDKKGLTDFELANTRIGSGSDHTVFLNFLGIPVVGLTFVGPYGVYHSLYDDFYWMNHFGDPGYRYHSLMTQLWGTVALRLANAEILPFDFESYGRHIHKFVSELDDSSHIAGHIDLASLERRIAEFQQAGREVNQSVVRAIESGSLNGANARGVNEELMHVERNWCNPEGIPGRPWFKHSLYAARYTYAHLELPGLTEAAEAGDWKQAVAQAKILEDELTRNTALLQHAKSELDSLAGTGTP